MTAMPIALPPVRWPDLGEFFGTSLGCIIHCLSFAVIAAAETDGSRLKYEDPTVLTGTIYESHAADAKVLFRFERRAVRTNDELEAIRSFFDPDGSLAARERVLYRGNELVEYELAETQAGGHGSARLVKDAGDQIRSRIHFTYTPPGGQRAREGSERRRGNVLVSDMVATFVISHWEDLAQGKEVECRLIVVPRAETVAFTFSKHSETVWRDRPAVIIQMKPAGWLIGLLVKPLFFTFEKQAPHRCLHYTGRTIPKHQVNGEWRDLDAVTVFDWSE